MYGVFCSIIGLQKMFLLLRLGRELDTLLCTTYIVVCNTLPQQHQEVGSDATVASLQRACSRGEYREGIIVRGCFVSNRLLHLVVVVDRGRPRPVVTVRVACPQCSRRVWRSSNLNCPLKWPAGRVGPFLGPGLTCKRLIVGQTKKVAGGAECLLT